MPSSSADRLIVEVFSDVVCPWCYIGERRLARAMAERPTLSIERRWRPYQLEPSMRRAGEPWDAFAEGKFGGRERAEEMFAHVAGVGAEEGVTFRFDRVASAPNTADAHRLILFARRHGREWAMADTLFRGYFEGGRDLGDAAQLAALAREAEVDPDAALAFLATDEGTREVRASQEDASGLGVEGIPFVVIDRRIGVAGAQSTDVIVQALDLAEAGRQEARGLAS